MVHPLPRLLSTRLKEPKQKKPFKVHCLFCNSKKHYQIFGAFTASGLDIVEQSYPVQILQKWYAHLRGLPLQSFHNVRPLVLIGSDHVHLITADKPVCQGTKGGPAAVYTALGGPYRGLRTAHQATTQYSSVFS